MVELGRGLRKIHLLESPKLSENLPTFKGSGNNLVENVKFENGKVSINESQYFEPVSEIA